VIGVSSVHDDAHDARVWDAGYLVGYRHATEGRANLLASKYPSGAEVVDLREWRIQHGRCECDRSRRAGGTGD
jgi:hypothetical protein